MISESTPLPQLVNRKIIIPSQRMKIDMLGNNKKFKIKEDQKSRLREKDLRLKKFNSNISDKSDANSIISIDVKSYNNKLKQEQELKKKNDLDHIKQQIQNEKIINKTNNSYKIVKSRFPTIQIKLLVSNLNMYYFKINDLSVSKKGDFLLIGYCMIQLNNKVCELTISELIPQYSDRFVKHQVLQLMNSFAKKNNIKYDTKVSNELEKFNILSDN